MSTHRLRRAETAQRLATTVSTPSSASNTTLPRPYGSHTVSTPTHRRLFNAIAFRRRLAPARSRARHCPGRGRESLSLRRLDVTSRRRRRRRRHRRRCRRRRCRRCRRCRPPSCCKLPYDGDTRGAYHTAELNDVTGHR